MSSKLLRWAIASPRAARRLAHVCSAAAGAAPAAAARMRDWLLNFKIIRSSLRLRGCAVSSAPVAHCPALAMWHTRRNPSLSVPLERYPDSTVRTSVSNKCSSDAAAATYLGIIITIIYYPPGVQGTEFIEGYADA